MKLSEAIRLGAMLKPKGTIDLLKGGRTCALGAALDAVGQMRRREEDPQFLVAYTALRERWPILNVRVAFPCDESTEPYRDLMDTAMVLNDSCEWTREQIADWVEQIERQQEPQIVTATEAVAVEV